MENLENIPLNKRMLINGFRVTDRVNPLNTDRMIIDKEGNDIGFMSPSECFVFIKRIEKLK